MTGKEIYEIVKREFPPTPGWSGVHVNEKFSMGYNNSGYVVSYDKSGECLFNYSHNRNLLNIRIL